jgi:hypothetical protein
MFKGFLSYLSRQRYGLKKKTIGDSNPRQFKDLQSLPASGREKH